MENKENFEAKTKDLQIQWQDHFQTRKQTWQALQVSATLTIALIAVDWRIDNAWVTIISSLLIALVATFGMQITIRHRNFVEAKKFSIIVELEKELGLNYDHPKPEEIKLYYVFFLTKSNTSLFILRMQFVIFIIALIFLVFRLAHYFENVVK